MSGSVRNGKFLTFRKHAFEGMNCERPPIKLDDIIDALEDADHDDGNQATKWNGRRTIIVYYTETEDEVNVRSVSATKGRLAP